MNEMGLLLPWALLCGTTFAIMFFDQRLRDRVSARGEVPDLRDRSFGIYYLLVLFSTMLILPVYFYVTRGTKQAIAIGAAWALLALVVSLILHLAIVVAMLGAQSVT